MFYVSSMYGNNMFGVTDTEDGVTDTLDSESLLILSNEIGLGIRGVSENSINPINYMEDVVQTNDINVSNMIRSFVDTLDYDTLCEIALGNGFKREINAIEKAGGTKVDEYIRNCVHEHIYDGQVADVVESCKNYASVVRQVDILNKQEVLGALQNNVCLVVQFSSKYRVTAFLGTTSLNIMNNLYGQNVVFYVGLHNAYLGYIERMSKLREQNYEVTFSDDIQRVYSCSLRVRNSGKKVVHKEMSSSEYSVNTASLLAMFALDVNNTGLFRNKFNSMVSELEESKQNPEPGVTDVQYNKDILGIVKKSIDDGINYLETEEQLREFMNSNNIGDCIDDSKISMAIDRIGKAFNRSLNEKNNGGKYIISV